MYYERRRPQSFQRKRFHFNRRFFFFTALGVLFIALVFVFLFFLPIFLETRTPLRRSILQQDRRYALHPTPFIPYPAAR